MEYDNDRVRRRTNQTEIFYWGLFVLIYPLINSASMFPSDWRIWPVLILVSMFLFPAYLLYSRIMGTIFLIQRRRLKAGLMTVLSFLVVQVVQLGIHSLILKFNLNAFERAYFSYSWNTLLRESFWTILNMSFAMAIFYIRKSIDEKELLDNVQRDSNFFKLRYLRAQLNPHFLFNTLNSIYSLSLQRSERTPEVVVKLADIMRYLIYECNEEKIPLDKEIEFIRNYIDIEKIRYKADIRFTVEGITAGVMIEPFLFISFIENGFKHAMDNSFAEPFIYITLKVEQGQIVLNVINSTNADLETQAKRRMAGKGLANSRSILELLYPDAYELDIIQTEKEENRNSQLRLHNARERLESLYPDAFTLDVLLSNSAFTVSLIIKTAA
ncbi:sensor histidine kinase [Flavitalea sp. BT771]|uniref:sensor histidine kinase n=1 Tax=Flavitalea sp. BT771 TaxID=3063329 RepID=UPI0026E1C303|nr:sensor histidine kinase [Flavitalea sp. BT771]MDO6430482.1 sensor histidine kinase [Flavitalea sp. BT771]MDV6219378.1 sensor histidine kinase [Flavitalea sp. BT771]